MNLKNVMMMFLMAMLSAYAQETAEKPSDRIFEKIAGGNDEFVFEDFGNHNVQVRIYQDMMVSCKDGLCTIFAVNSQGHEFKTEFKVGLDDTNPDASVVAMGPFIGLVLSYTYKTCTQRVLIPRSLYMAINTYMYHLMTEDGGTRRTFNPSDEAMLILYSTIMAQAKGC